jgi:hypothetical protein
MWTQIVGKIRMVQSPWQNHSWHVTLQVTPRGLTTGTVPHGRRWFSLDFDFIDHFLVIRTCDDQRRTVALAPRDTADFYAELMETLELLDLPVTINTLPNEVETTLRFDQDRVHRHYDGEAAQRFWRVLGHADRVFHQFRSGFHGKCSPVQFFWGSFDLAVTRFSGRPAPDHPGGLPNMPLWVAQEAYSQEVASAGFWPGNEAFPEPLFYAYAYPGPEGFAQAPVQPEAARWHEQLGEFALPLSAVVAADDPDEYLLAFLQSTFDAAARLGNWNLAGSARRHFPALT